MKRASSAERHARQLTTKVPQEPIQVAEKWRLKFFYALRANSSTLRATSVQFLCPGNFSILATPLGRGWPQRRQRRFSSIPRVCPFNVLLLIDTTREHACDRWRIP